MDVTIVGPHLDASGYAYHTRTIALWLHRLGVRVRLEPVPWGSAQITPPEAEMAILEQMRRNPPACGPVLYITVANTFRKHQDRPSIGWTMLETDRIPLFWADLCNAMDEVWVPTEFNRETFALSGVEPAKLHVVPLGTDPDRVDLAVGVVPVANLEWIPRKGYDILLRAYLEEFSWNEDVSLTIKGYNNSAYDPEGRAIREEIMRVGESIGRPDLPKIILLSRVIPPWQVPSLYRAADCYVLPTRGEGWNHPALEASACGVPVITTAWSGHLTFLNEANSYLIPIQGLEPVPQFGVPNDAVYAGSHWAVPSLIETRRLMRRVFTHREEARAKARRARSEIIDNWTWEKSARQVLERLSRW